MSARDTGHGCRHPDRGSGRRRPAEGSVGRVSGDATRHSWQSPQAAEAAKTTVKPTKTLAEPAETFAEPAETFTGVTEILVKAVEIVALLVSPMHAYEGRPGDGPRPDAVPVGRDRVEVRAGLGLVGDRYFNRPAHRRAAVTVLAVEALDLLAERLGLAAPPDPLLLRRNIVVRGFPVDELAAGRDAYGGKVDGAVFALDSGAGPVRFQAHRPANPCAWMDAVVAPGAFRGLRGRGGVRCVPLDDGVLRRGPAALTVWPRAGALRTPR